MVNRVETIVIGGGAMGSAAAWEMAKRGRPVTLLERFERGHKNGSSHGASRNFSVGYSDPAYVKMLVEAQLLWRELEAEADASLLEMVGIVNHGTNPDYDRVKVSLAAFGIAAEFLSPVEASRRWPGIRFDGRVLYTPDAGRLNADASVSALQRAAIARGAEVRHNAHVTRLQVVDDDLVRVSMEDEVLEAKRVIVTVGAWTSKVVGNLLTLPQLVVREAQPTHFAVRGEESEWPGFNHKPSAGLSSYDYWLSAIYGMFTPGEGVKVGWHGAGPIVDPDARTAGAERLQLASLRRYAREWLPGVDADQFDYASCTTTTTPSSNFILSSQGPLTVGGGFSGHGFKFTPAIGRILADLCEGTGSAPVLNASPWD